MSSRKIEQASYENVHSGICRRIRIRIPAPSRPSAIATWMRWPGYLFRYGETEQRLRQDTSCRGARGRPTRPGTRGMASAATSCRLEKIRAAKAELEKEANEKDEKAKAGVEAKIAKGREQEARTGKKAVGRDPKAPNPERFKPDPRARRNFTDPETRIMPDGANKGSFAQAPMPIRVASAAEQRGP